LSVFKTYGRVFGLGEPVLIVGVGYDPRGEEIGKTIYQGWVEVLVSRLYRGRKGWYL
jgi:hypothetical protein